MGKPIYCYLCDDLITRKVYHATMKVMTIKGLVVTTVAVCKECRNDMEYQ